MCRSTAIARLERRSVAVRLADWIFGYDYFISYAWSDGRLYAKALYERLEHDGFTCFLDSEAYNKGDDWKTAGSRQLRKTTQLILVATPSALSSQPVLREVQIFSKLKRRIVPIEFGGQPSVRIQQSALGPYVPSELLAIRELPESSSIGPSAEALEALKASFQRLRQHDKRLRVLTLTALILAVLTIGATYFGFYAQQQRRIAEANMRHARAQQLAADAQLLRLEAPESATASLLLSIEALKQEYVPTAFDAWVESAQLLPPIKATLRPASEITWVSSDAASDNVLYVDDRILYRWAWSSATEAVAVATLSEVNPTPIRVGAMTIC